MVKDLNYIKFGFVIAIGAVLAVILILYLSAGKEIRTSSFDTDSVVEFLDCETTSIDNAFFASDIAINSHHEIKVTFSNNDPDKISYSYFGEFLSDDIAETENAKMHANYNKYMGATVDPNVLTPTFSRVNNTVTVNLYSKIKDLSSVVGVFFFLNPEDAVNLKNYSYDKLVSLYNLRGFSCVDDS